jgi:hypothetical protein
MTKEDLLMRAKKLEAYFRILRLKRRHDPPLATRKEYDRVRKNLVGARRAAKGWEEKR